MNKVEFTDLIKNPEKLGTEHIEILKNIVAEFPYFSTAHVLLTKALYNTKHYEYEKQLKITALSVGNRAVLYKFLNNEELELDDEVNFMKVPIELKVEKVSKPDFEMSKQEEDAILLEANAILNQPTEYSNEELSLSEIKNKIEDLPITFNDEVEEKVDLVVVVEKADEVNLIDDVEKVDEVNLINEVEKVDLVGGIDLIEKAVETNLEEEVVLDIENEVVKVAETLEPKPFVSTDKIEFHDFNIFENENDFQLADTEGMLVRFVNNEEFLPDFDESSLFAEDIEIETITKSVLPNNEFKPQPIHETNTAKEIEKEAEDIVVNIDVDNIDLKENSDETDIKNNAISLENLLMNNDENSENSIENSFEKDSVFEAINNLELNSNIDEVNDKSNNIEELVLEEIVQAEEVQTEEVQAEEVQKEEVKDIQAEITTSLEKEISNKINSNDSFTLLDINNEDVNIETSDNIVEGVNENHSFIDWLNLNKKTDENTVENANEEAKLNNEDDEFVENIKQIIKLKSKLSLEKEISAEINAISNANHIIEQSIDDNLILPNEIVKTDTNELSINESIESYLADLDNTDTETENNEKESIDLETENSVEETELKAEDEKFIIEPNNYEIQSILPDFEALKKEFIPYIKFDKKDGLIPSYEAPAFEPTFKNTFPESKIEIPKEILNDDKVSEDKNAFENNETETVFVNAPINEYDFENSFNEVYEPIKHNYKVTSIKVEITETLIDEKKQPIETHQNDVESILDKFLKENPSITRPKSEFFDPSNVAKMSVVEKDEIVSETLAGIYLKQGLIKKAISTYEKLSLIYPHKITYFAALINQLKTEHNIN